MDITSVPALAILASSQVCLSYADNADNADNAVEPGTKVHEAAKGLLGWIVALLADHRPFRCQSLCCPGHCSFRFSTFCFRPFDVTLRSHVFEVKEMEKQNGDNSCSQFSIEKEMKSLQFLRKHDPLAFKFVAKGEFAIVDEEKVLRNLYTGNLLTLGGRLLHISRLVR
jgi:hypothetical protein